MTLRREESNLLKISHWANKTSSNSIKTWYSGFCCCCCCEIDYVKMNRSLFVSCTQFLIPEWQQIFYLELLNVACINIKFYICEPVTREFNRLPTSNGFVLDLSGWKLRYKITSRSKVNLIGQKIVWWWPVMKVDHEQIIAW